MLSAFDILKPLDEYGTPVDLTVEYDFSLTLYAYIGFSPNQNYVFANCGGIIFLTESRSRSSADSNHAMKESKH